MDKATADVWSEILKGSPLSSLWLVSFSTQAAMGVTLGMVRNGVPANQIFTTPPFQSDRHMVIKLPIEPSRLDENDSWIFNSFEQIADNLSLPITWVT